MNRWVRSVDFGRERAAAPSVDRPRGRRARAGLPFIAAVLASCGPLIGDEAIVGGETHFLVTCEEECGPGLSCIAGVCTRGCEPGFSSCSELSADAACVSSTSSADLAGFGGTCDVRCSDDADCSSLPAGHTCRQGACRADAPADLGSTGSLQSAPVHAVDIESCKSGLRWMGDDRPSAEMRPGSDCVACHRDAGARPLMVGGTVYNIPGNGRPQPLDGCFGLEGVEVVITDAAGREFSSVTNRAGNFYIEGDESDFAMPYSATLKWTLDGQAMNTAMFTMPSHGGCARCHGDDAQANGSITGDLPADRVIPTSAIFAPGLYR